MISFSTADLSDQHPGARVCEPLLRDFGARRRFYGQAVTLRCIDDNSLVRETLSAEGAGRVLVVDAGGSLRCAMLGDRLASLALRNGWAGIVLHGCLRDAATIAGMDLGIKALATQPRRSEQRGAGIAQIPVRLAGVEVRPGDYVYSDEDGILIAEYPLV